MKVCPVHFIWFYHSWFSMVIYLYTTFKGVFYIFCTTWSPAVYPSYVRPAAENHGHCYLCSAVCGDLFVPVCMVQFDMILKASLLQDRSYGAVCQCDYATANFCHLSIVSLRQNCLTERIVNTLVIITRCKSRRMSTFSMHYHHIQPIALWHVTFSSFYCY